MSQHKINTKASEPSLFKHFFVVTYAFSGLNIGGGAIVTGGIWDRSDIPRWKTVHGFCKYCSNNGEYLHVSFLTYLGPNWRPEFEELSNEVRKIVGVDDTMRFVRYGAK